MQDISLLFPRYKHQNFSEEPLGVLILAAVLRDNGFTTQFIDGTAEPSIAHTIETLKSTKPDFLGISTQTVYADYAFRIAKRYKEYVPDCKVILGGPHPTIFPKQTLAEKCVDFVIIGEGEETFPELLKEFDSPEKVKGIGYKKSKTLIINQSRPPIQDLNSLPFPARDLMHDKYYDSKNATLISSRGCPFNCSFCQPTLRKIFGVKYRQRSPENVIAEIGYIQKEFDKRGKTFETFGFTDDGLTYVKPWLEKFCNLLVQNNIKKEWSANTRADTMPNEHLLGLMIKSGFKGLSIGVESGDDFIRNEILGKQLSREKILEAFSLAHKVGLYTTAYLMVGAPHESMQSINNTLMLLDEIQPDNSGVSVCVPLPGTHLYYYCEKNNLIANISSWHDYDYYLNSGVKLENFTKQEIQDVRSAMRYAIVAHKFFKKRIGIGISYKQLFYFFYNPLVMPLFKELGEGRVADYRRSLQNRLGISFS